MPTLSGRAISRQAVSLGAGTFVSQLLTAGIFLITARQSDPASFGRVVAAIAVGSIAISFLEFGTNTLWLRQLAAGQMGPEAYGARLTGKVLANAIIGIGLVLVLVEVNIDPVVLLTVPYCFGLQLAMATQVGPRAAGLAHRIGLFLIADRLTAGTILFVLTASGTNPGAAMLIGFSAGSLVNASLSFATTPRQFRPVLGRRIRNPWKGSTAFGAFGIATSLQSLDVTVLAAVAGPAAAGILGAVSRWTQPMVLLAGSVAQVLAPSVATAESHRDAMNRIRQQAWLLAFAILGCVIVAVLSPWAVPILLGAEYAGSAAVLTVLALAMIPAVLNQPLITLLQLRGQQVPLAVTWMVVALSQLGCVAATAKMCGAMAAAGAQMAAQTVLLLALVTLAIRSTVALGK